MIQDLKWPRAVWSGLAAVCSATAGLEGQSWEPLSYSLWYHALSDGFWIYVIRFRWNGGIGRYFFNQHRSNGSGVFHNIDMHFWGACKKGNFYKPKINIILFLNHRGILVTQAYPSRVGFGFKGTSVQTLLQYCI